MPSSGPVAFSRLLREVKKFGPNELLRALAAEGAVQSLRHRDDPRSLIDGAGYVTPWAIAELARESIVHGSQRGQTPPDRRDVDRLCALYGELDDPISEGTPGSLDRFLVRVAYEQFRWQLSEFEELARPHALLVDAASRVPGATAFSEQAWRAVLGCTVDDFIDLGFFLYVWAAQHQGVVNLAWMDLPHFAPVLQRFPRERVEVVVATRLAATPAELRAMDSKLAAGSSVAEHRFNPLAARPLVRMRDGSMVAPHPLLILHRIGVNGLYYDRVSEPHFTDQLGAVFEEYVGMHLGLIRTATVTRSVEVGRAQEAIDYVVVLPEVVLLVEVKATRLTEPARAGLDALHADRTRTIGKAFTQISRAAGFIRDEHPALSFVPRDRPVRGLVVTLEPYWNAVTEFADLPQPAVPTTVASVRELEYLAAVGVVSEVGPALMRMSTSHSNSALHRAVEHLDRARNPILERAWQAVFTDAA